MVKESKGQKVNRSKGQRVKGSTGQRVKGSTGQRVQGSKGQQAKGWKSHRWWLIIFLGVHLLGLETCRSRRRWLVRGPRRLLGCGSGWQFLGLGEHYWVRCKNTAKLQSNMHPRRRGTLRTKIETRFSSIKNSIFLTKKFRKFLGANFFLKNLHQKILQKRWRGFFSSSNNFYYMILMWNFFLEIRQPPLHTFPKLYPC